MVHIDEVEARLVCYERARQRAALTHCPTSCELRMSPCHGVYITMGNGKIFHPSMADLESYNV